MCSSTFWVVGGRADSYWVSWEGAIDDFDPDPLYDPPWHHFRDALGRFWWHPDPEFWHVENHFRIHLYMLPCWWFATIGSPWGLKDPCKTLLQRKTDKIQPMTQRKTTPCAQNEKQRFLLERAAVKTWKIRFGLVRKLGKEGCCRFREAPGLAYPLVGTRYGAFHRLGY